MLGGNRRERNDADTLVRDFYVFDEVGTAVNSELMPSLNQPSRQLFIKSLKATVPGWDPACAEKPNSQDEPLLIPELLAPDLSSRFR